MGEIKYTREDLVNHDAVSAIIKNKRGEVLIQDHIKMSFWTIPIGKVKPTQTNEEGIKEEIFEECNLTINRMKLIDSKKYTYERQGKEIQLTNHMYEIEEFDGDLQNKEPHKHKSQKFYSIEDIKELEPKSDCLIRYLKLIQK